MKQTILNISKSHAGKMLATASKVRKKRFGRRSKQ